MSGPDGIDERFGTLMGELRSGEVAASPELRERVRAITERKPEPPAIARFGRFRRRQLGFVLVPVAAGLAAAVGVGVFSSLGTSSKQKHVVLGANFAPTTHRSNHARGMFKAPPSKPASLTAT